jgi:hypothetical protein
MRHTIAHIVPPLTMKELYIAMKVGQQQLANFKGWCYSYSYILHFISA